MSTTMQQKVIGLLPPGWQVARVGDLAEPNNKRAIRIGPFGSQLRINELVEEGILVLGIEHVLENRYYDTGRKFITEEKFERLKGFAVKPGDLLMTMMGTIGRVGIVPQDIGKAIIGSHLLKISLDQARCLPRYMAYALSHQSPVYRQVGSLAQGSIMQGLNTEIQ